MSGSFKTTVRILPGVGDMERALAAFNVESCACAFEEDRLRLLSCMYVACGSLASLNDRVRAMIIACLQRTSGVADLRGLAAAPASGLHGGPRPHRAASDVAAAGEEHSTLDADAKNRPRDLFSREPRPGAAGHLDTERQQPLAAPPSPAAAQQASRRGHAERVVPGPLRPAAIAHSGLASAPAEVLSEMTPVAPARSLRSKLRRSLTWILAVAVYVAIFIPWTAALAAPAQRQCERCARLVGALPVSPDGWVTWRGREYVFSSSVNAMRRPRGHGEARDACAHAGGWLVAIGDAAEDELVQCLGADGFFQAFIGIVRADYLDTETGDPATPWVWLAPGAEGRSNYTNWSGGKPSGPWGKAPWPKCAMIRRQGAGGWQSAQCHGAHPGLGHFWCERPVGRRLN
mmetsp:Transcript_16062/g.46871  ORF Transcript_16062/g.46871 Transcript_16062/m.46871 type:complete len:403 (+) Transcript_16062:1397-2605(+)